MFWQLQKIVFQEMPLLMNISWLQNVMDTPIIDIKIYDNDNFDVIKYMKLKSELYDVISTW